MQNLRFLLVQNQSYLSKLRARTRYCSGVIAAFEADSHKQYGPYSGYWDEWLIQAEEMKNDLYENTAATDVFLFELLDFIITFQDKGKLNKSDTNYLLEVISLAEGKLSEQKYLLDEINQRLMIHKQLTNKLLLVKAIDGLDD